LCKITEKPQQSTTDEGDKKSRNSHEDDKSDNINITMSANKDDRINNNDFSNQQQNQSKNEEEKTSKANGKVFL
jgi:hypothetical protein